MNNKTGKFGMVMGVIMAGMLFMALIIVLRTQQTPVQQLERQLTLGAKYLESLEYDKALIAYQEALTIDRKNAEAYLGAIEAYEKLDRQEEFIAFYEEALLQMDNLTSEEVEKNNEDVAEVYLAAVKIYNDAEQVNKVLERGYDKTKSNVLQASISNIPDESADVEQETVTESTAETEIVAETQSEAEKEPQEIIVSEAATELSSETMVEVQRITLSEEAQKELFYMASVYSHVSYDVKFDEMSQLQDNDEVLSKFLWWYLLGKGNKFGTYVGMTDYYAEKYEFDVDMVSNELNRLFGGDYNLERLSKYDGVNGHYAYYKDNHIYIENVGVGSESAPVKCKVINDGKKNFAYVLMQSDLMPDTYWIYQMGLEAYENENGFIITSMTGYGEQYYNNTIAYDCIVDC